MKKIEEDSPGCMQEIGEEAHKRIGSKYGFMVLIFPWENDLNRTAMYISNGRREDMIKTLREQADSLEAGLDIVGDTTEKNSSQ